MQEEKGAVSLSFFFLNYASLYGMIGCNFCGGKKELFA
jgi:hypothetical protein